MAKEFDRKAWLKERQSGLGGSDMGLVMGLQAFGKNRATVYDEKVALVVDDPEPTADQERGRVLEPVANMFFCKKTGRKTRSQPMRRHKDHPILFASVDRQQIADPRGPGVLEIKVPRLSSFSRMKAKGLDDIYKIQMQHYLEVFGYAWGTFCVYNADSGQLIWFDVDRETDFGKRIVEEGLSFWETYIVPRVRPPEIQPPKIELPDIEGDIKVVSDAEFLEAMTDMWEARSLVKSAKQLQEVADQTVKDLIKDRLGGKFGAVETPNNERIHYKMHDGKKSYQRERLQNMGPLNPIKVMDVLLGETTLDPEDVNWLMGQMHEKALIDVEDSWFFKVGEPYATFTPYQLKPRAEED